MTTTWGPDDVPGTFMASTSVPDCQQAKQSYFEGQRRSIKLTWRKASRARHRDNTNGLRLIVHPRLLQVPACALGYRA